MLWQLCIHWVARLVYDILSFKYITDSIILHRIFLSMLTRNIGLWFFFFLNSLVVFWYDGYVSHIEWVKMYSFYFLKVCVELVFLKCLAEFSSLFCFGLCVSLKIVNFRSYLITLSLSIFLMFFFLCSNFYFYWSVFKFTWHFFCFPSSLVLSI